MTWKYFKWLYHNKNIINYYKYIIKAKKLFKKAVWYECSYVLPTPPIRAIGKSTMLEKLANRYDAPVISQYSFNAQSIDLTSIKLLMRNRVVIVDDVSKDLISNLISANCIVIGFYNMSEWKGKNNNVWIKTSPFIQK